MHIKCLSIDYDYRVSKGHTLLQNDRNIYFYMQ